MSRTTLCSLLIALALALISSTVRAAEPLAILHVYWNAPTRPDPRLIEKSLTSAYADALKKHLKVADPASIFTLTTRFDGNDIELVITKKNAVQPPPEEIIAMIKEHFLETASNFFLDLSNKSLDRAMANERNAIDEAERAREQSRQRLVQIRTQLREITRRVDVSADSLRSAITRTEDERDRLALDLEGQRVRKEAIHNTIAETTKKAQNQLTEDRIAVELSKLIASRDKDFERLQQLKAEKLVAQAELDAAEARIGEVRLRLWERQEAVSRTTGGDLVADLNRELATLSINMVETEVRLKRLNDSVDRFAKASDLIDAMDFAQSAHHAAEAAFVEAQSRLADRQRALRQHQPPIVVLVSQP
jgi:predicted  nucleic acid-binding Zn-ribbon protein